MAFLRVVETTSNPKHDDAPRPSRAEQVRAARRAVRYHPLTGHAAPWPVTALLWAAAAAGHTGGDAATVVAVAAPVVAVVWWFVWSRRRNRDQRRARRMHVIAVTVAAQAWLLWALQAGAGGWRAAVLWAGMYALMAPYWRRRYIPVPADYGPEEPPTGELLPPVVEKWVSRVQVPGGALPGAYLTGHHHVKNGEAWDINLVPGKQQTQTAIGAHPLIVSALDHLTIDQVIIDRHPSNSLARARLTVVEGHPLNRRLDHPGPNKVYDPVTGYATIGMHPDDEPAQWGFEIPDWGVPSGFLVGGTGSGKSTLMTNLAAIAAHTGRFAIWAGCPLGGQSFPALLDHASWAARTKEEILLQAEAAMSLIVARGAVNGLLKRVLHMPTADEPGVLLFLDEFHRITAGWQHAKRATELLMLITREGRKAGVAVIGADQGFDLQGTFGNDDDLRANIRFKNLWVGRTTSDVITGMITGLEVDPTALPDEFPDGTPTSGLGYLVGKRTAPCRTWYTPNPEELLRQAPVRELEKVGAKFAGAGYQTRRDRALLSQAAGAVQLAQDDPELMARILNANPELRSMVDADGIVEAAAAAAAAVEPGKAERKPAFTAGDIPPAPRFEYEEAPEPDEPRTVLDKVRALIREGVRATGELEQRTGASPTAVRNALNTLVDNGEITRVKKGDYEPARVAA